MRLARKDRLDGAGVGWGWGDCGKKDKEKGTKGRDRGERDAGRGMRGGAVG